MSSIFQNLQSLILIVWLPGVFYIWIREGFRKQNEWQILIKGLVVGVFLSFIWWFLYTLFSASVFNVKGSEIMKGAITLTTKSLEAVGDESHRYSVILFILSNYLFCLFMAIMRRGIQENKRPFAIQKRSALDVELEFIQGKRLIADIRVIYKSGNKITGKLTRYSLEEPREIVIELEDSSFTWIRIDEQVLQVEIHNIRKPERGKILQKLITIKGFLKNNIYRFISPRDQEP